MKLLIFIFLFPSFVKAQNISDTLSQWKDGVAIDGRLDEWQQENFRYDKETFLWYNLANDDVFLYLAVKKDELFSKVFNWGGLMFTVSTNGKESRDRNPSVIFPRAIEGEQRIPNDELTSIEVQNMPQIGNREINIYNEYGIQVGWTLENGDEGTDPIYRYELAIPLQLLNIQKEKIVGFNILLRGGRETPLTPLQIALKFRLFSCHTGYLTFDR